MNCDVCVVGLGGIGSAILAQCASRGARVIGVEQFARIHGMGSSAGKTRMIRKAYFENPDYVPLVLRSYELWYELQRAVGEEILRITGVLSVGRADSEIIAGTQRAAREHQLTIDLLDRGEVLSRFPMLKLHDDEIAIFEPDAGVLKPERATASHLTLAERKGAVIKTESPMRNWEPSGDGFAVELADGTRIQTRRLILALGPWFRDALAETGVPIRVQRNVQAWFAPENDDYTATQFPAFLLDRAGLPAPLYGFPDFGDGVKAAFHGFGELTNADEVVREIDFAEDVAPIARVMNDWMPRAASTLIEAKVCMYSHTPDEHFVIDHHPQHAGVILCGGFSGHGFKFAPVVGEIAAELALEGGTRHKIDFLSLRRFANGTS